MKFEEKAYTVAAPVHRPLCAAVVSDIHDEPYGDVLDAIRQKKPDLILIPGDIIDGHRNTAENSFRMLAEFAGLCPTFMSLGNHERIAADAVRNAAAEGGVRLLEDACEEFGGLLIGGLNSGYVTEEIFNQNHWRETPAPDLDWLRKFDSLPGFKVLLSHHPEYYPRFIRDTGVDLILSGHAHGGQWRLFGHPVFAPGQGLFPKYAQGIHDGRLIVSRGLANNGPVPRFGNPRELIFLSFVPRVGLTGKDE